MLKEYLSKVLNYSVPQKNNIYYTGPIVNGDYSPLLDCCNFAHCFFSEQDCKRIDSLNISNKLFENCVFVLYGASCSFVNFLKLNNFLDCVFFADEYAYELYKEELSILTDSNSKLNNQIKITNFIELLAYYYNNNLALIPKHILNGIRIRTIDLSNAILPTYSDFFNCICDNHIFDCKLPAIDFNKYNINTKFYFYRSIFEENTKHSMTSIQCPMYCCTFDKLDLHDFGNTEYTINYFNCTFNELLLPKNDENFFLRNNFSMCSFPKYNFSNFNITSDTFKDCILDAESTLFKKVDSIEKVNILNNLVTIPTQHLSDFCMFAYIKDINNFILKYKKALSLEDLYILKHKEKLIS